MKKKKQSKKTGTRTFEDLGAAAAKKSFPQLPPPETAPPHFAAVTAGVVNVLRAAPKAPPKRTRQRSLVLRVLEGTFNDVRNAAETLRVSQAEIVEQAVEDYVGRIRKERRERGEDWVIAPPPRRTRNA